MGRLRAAAISSWRMSPARCTSCGRAFVVVVEADLAAGDHFGLGQQSVELGQGGVVDLRRVVRIDAGAGVEARQVCAVCALAVELAAEVERLVHLRRPLADADGEHRAHAGLARRGPSIASRSSA